MQPLIADQSFDIRQIPIFQHFAEKYKCCCSTVHVRKYGWKVKNFFQQGAYLIGIVSTLIWLVDLSDLYSGITHSEHSFFLVFEYFHFIVSIPSLILFFIGLKKYRSVFLFPFMAHTVFYLVMLAVVAFLCCITLFDPSITFGHYNETLLNSWNDRERKWMKEKFDRDVHPHYFVRRDNFYYLMLYTVSFAINAGFLHIVYKCYKYYKDLENHRNKLTFWNH